MNALSTLSRDFQIPAFVLARKASDEDIDALLLAERWLLLNCIGPLKALQSELDVLHRQAEHRQWINDLTPGVPSLAALSRALGTSRQTLHTRRKKTSGYDDEPQHHNADDVADSLAATSATEQQRPDSGLGSDMDRSP